MPGRYIRCLRLSQQEQDRLSAADQEVLRWSSAKPAGPARKLTAEEIAREYGDRVAARADRRLAKEFAAYDKLEAINAKWAQGRTSSGRRVDE